MLIICPSYSDNNAVHVVVILANTFSCSKICFCALLYVLIISIITLLDVFVNITITHITVDYVNV